MVETKHAPRCDNTPDYTLVRCSCGWNHTVFATEGDHYRDQALGPSLAT